MTEDLDDQVGDFVWIQVVFLDIFADWSCDNQKNRGQSHGFNDPQTDQNETLFREDLVFR